MMRVFWVRTFFYLALLVLWQLAAALKIWPEWVFPSPHAVLRTAWTGLADKTIFLAVGVSMRRLLVGFSLSLFLGMGLGVAVGRVALLRQTVGSLVLGLQTLPSICWLPLALLWFGLNEKAILFVVIMGAFLSITIATASGLETVPPLWERAGRNLGARGWRLIWYVLLPAALPSILSGLKQGWSFAWRSLMSGELLFISGGLGQVLMTGRELNDMSLVVVGMVVIIFIALVFEKLVFARAERYIQERWGFAGRA